MKRILIVCLLGMGLLLPSTTITAKEFFTKRIVSVFIEDDLLGITSDPSTGTLTDVKIFNSSKQKVMEQSSSGYEDYVDVSGLPSGNYTVQVFTTLTVYSENVYVN